MCNIKRTVFCFWTGDNKMSDDRTKCLWSLKNTGVDVSFITKSVIDQMQDKLHPKFIYLSDVHKSDYLRVFFMHHIGGGYSDIKIQENSWVSSFKRLEQSDKYCLGYTEVSPDGVAPVGGEQEKLLKKNYKSLIGNCAYIFKRDTPFTAEWIKRADALLDSKDFNGEYPLKWTELLGNIFHPLCLEYKDMILHDDTVKPNFKKRYR